MFGFASRCLERSLAQWVKCAYRKLRGVFGLLQKSFWYAKSGHKLHIFQLDDFLLNVYKSKANTYSKEPGLLMYQDRGKDILIILKICQ